MRADCLFQRAGCFKPICRRNRRKVIVRNLPVGYAHAECILPGYALELPDSSAYYDDMHTWHAYSDHATVLTIDRKRLWLVERRYVCSAPKDYHPTAIGTEI